VIVFDTNVLVSAALISGSRADSSVRSTLLRGLPLVFSEATFAELEEVLMREKFDRYVSQKSRKALLKVWKNAATFVSLAAVDASVDDCRDATDNKFLELALRTEAKLIVTGDPDLLVLDPWRGIRIVRLRDFEEVIQQEDFRLF
jgi:putative PIN family toxin of toxin-antitoxin system